MAVRTSNSIHDRTSGTSTSIRTFPKPSQPVRSTSASAPRTSTVHSTRCWRPWRGGGTTTRRWRRFRIGFEYS